MSTPIVMISTFEIPQGELEHFKESVRKSVAFVEANGTQLLGKVCIDEQNLRAYSCQIQPDSETILEHWQIHNPYIHDVRRHSVPKRLDVYGQPSEAVMEELRPLADEDFVVTVTPDFCGFDRLQPRTEGDR